MASAPGLLPAHAEVKANELVGVIKLQSVSMDPWIENLLATSTELYRSNWTAAHNSSMPMMIVGTNLITGSMRHPGEIFSLLESSFGLHK